MSLTLTVVRTPEAMPRGRWDTLRRSAPGHGAYDVRLRVQDAARPSGGQLQGALFTWMGASPETMSATVAGLKLAELPSGSPRIHPGMVVVLRPSRPSPEEGPGPRPLPRAAPGDRTPLQLCVDEGPDAGRLVPLPRGRHTVGRGPVDISVADPGVAREHCVIDVGARSVSLSTPSTSARRRPGHRTAPWTSRDPLPVGDSSLLLITDAPAPATPGLWPPAQEPVAEEPPEGKHRMLLLMACVPLVVGIVLVLVTGMWFFLLFSAVSALVAAATMADAARRRRRFRVAVDAAASRWADRVDDRLDTPGALMRRLRSGAPEDDAPVSSSPQEAPPQGGAPPAAGAPVVRLGHGVTCPAVDVPTTTRRVEEVSVHCGVGVPMRAGEHVTVTGPDRTARRLLRWILAQLIIRERTCRAEVLVIGDPDLWPSDLEDHGVSSLPAEAFRTGDLPVSTGPGVLVVDAPITADLLDDALRHGWCVLTHRSADDERRASAADPGWDLDLPSGELRRRDVGPSAESPVGSGDGAAASSGGSGEARGLVVDGLSRTTLETLLRLALPRCAVLDVEGTVPDQLEVPLPSRLMTRSAQASLISVLGRSTAGEETLDLVEDGPHILLAGTSGSGKSELLKALILGWAARYGPEELALVLFDFKGGATFQHLAELEHSLGLITDLSQAQAERTLEGIRSELVRREKLFLEAGAGDYPEYRRMRPDEPLARILVVIDEFRIFSHELPETMDELMRLATLGRSLGLHLVLSTQRPQGVVTADIRANLGSIVSLRLRSEDESRDLVGTVEAGRIPRNLPGRGILRRPGEQPVLFQTGLLATAAEKLTVSPAQAAPAGASGAPAGGAATRDVVRVLAQACREADRTRLHTPLLPPLAQELDPRTARGGTPGPPVLGRLDLPGEQDQTSVRWDPRRHGSLGLIGEGGSGGREALVALTSQLLSAPAGPHVLRWEVHLLDGDRSLQQFADRPDLGSWLTDEHPAEVEHLLQRLQDELTARRTRRGQRVQDEPDEPEVVLVVSGYPQWHQAAQGPAGGAVEHLLGTLISDGADVGISVVLSGGRELASGRVGSRLPRRVYLPHGVSQDTRMLWPRLRPVDGLTGRGVLLDTDHPSPGAEIQLVTVPEPKPSGQGTGAAWAGGTARPRLCVRPLPEQIGLDQVCRAAPAVPEPGGASEAVIGVVQFTHQPVLWRAAPVTLILGTSGTGRTTCLEVLARQLDDAALLRPHSPWSEEPPARTVLLDDADRFEAQQHRVVERWIHQGVRVVGTAQPSGSLYTQIPWSHQARSSPGNVLLSPTHRSQADFFAVSMPMLPHPIPGRAVHLRPEGPQLIQWAWPG